MSNLKRTALRPAVFLDRDGTLNIEKDYLFRVEDFVFTEGAQEAVRLLNDAGFLVVVVSNQSGIARGYYGQEDVKRLHDAVDRLLAHKGAHVDAWYFCPHHPEGTTDQAISCDCRKPAPGMLLQAAKEYGIDLADSYMVGDKRIDVEAGHAAGCHSILVATGYGHSEAAGLPKTVPCCENLLAAARLICAAEHAKH